MSMLVLASDATNEGDGVNVLPIAVILLVIGVGLYLWHRRRR